MMKRRDLGAPLRQKVRCSLSVPLSTVRSATPSSLRSIPADVFCSFWKGVNYYG